MMMFSRFVHKVKGRRKGFNPGFTMVEIIVTMGIMVLLLALAIPGTFALQKSFKMTELDSYAKQVLIASQNNLTVSKAAGTLEDVATLGVEIVGSDHRYVTEAHNPIKVLPTNAIDAVILKNYYIIRYNPKTSAVTEAFYAEKPFDVLNALTNLSGHSDAAVAGRKDAKIGYFSGGDLTSIPSVTIDAPELVVVNAEELTVTVSTDPRWTPLNSQLSVVVESATNADIQFTLLEGEDFNRDIATGEAKIILDSLKPSTGGAKIQFAKLAIDNGAAANFPFDGQISIYANLEPLVDTDTVRGSTSNVEVANGLYAQKKGTEVQIAYPRHLQNLDRTLNPSVSGTFSAVQMKNIFWPSYAAFMPIAPGKSMTSYDGKGFGIENIIVNGSTTPTPEQEDSAGLFAVIGNESTSETQLKNIKLINMSLNATNFVHAGSLVGKAKNVTIDNCSVYVRGVVTDNSKYGVSNKVSAGGYAGGLIGGLLDGAKITNSFVGIPNVLGSSVGGFIGYVGGGDKTTITNSYASVDNIEVSSSGYAAMFIARSDAGTANLSIDRCYGVGNLSKAPSSASRVNGFIGGTGTVARSYCATSFFEKGADGKPLNLNGIGGFGSNAATAAGCYYLTPEGAKVAADGKGKALAYGDLNIDSAELSGYKGIFSKLTSALSHPYKTELKGEAYPFPSMLKSDGTKMAHYGSWPLPPKFKPGLAYLEEYDNSKIGVYGYLSSGDKLNTLLGNEVGIKNSAFNEYGILLDPSQNANDYEVKVLKKNLSGNDINTHFRKIDSALDVSKTLKVNVNGTDYNYVPFTNAAINEIVSLSYNNPAGDAVERRSARVLISAGSNYAEFEMHPLFGAAVSPAKANMGVVDATDNLYQIRTQQQLANIGAFQKTNPSLNSNTSAVNRYEFVQTHDVVISGDKWKAIENISGKSFKGKHKVQSTIKGLTAPLFSTISGEHVTMKDIIISDATISIGSGALNTGIFAIASSADVSNVQILNSRMSTTSSVELSGFMDRVSGKGAVTNCKVESTKITSNTSAYGFMRTNPANSELEKVTVNDCVIKGDTTAVGLIGTNHGKITDANVFSTIGRSYDSIVVQSTGNAYGFAMINEGSISNASVSAKTEGSKLAVGFVGKNTGAIANSYSSSEVTSSATGAITSGFVDETTGSINNCYSMVTLTSKNGSGYGFVRNIAGAGKVTNCYAANNITGRPSNMYGFNKLSTTGGITNCYYLLHDSFSAEKTGAQKMTYEDMTTTNALKNKLPSSEWSSTGTAKPYDDKLEKKKNEFPKLVDLIHHGDWIMIPEIPGGLVYFEKYEGDPDYYISGIDGDGLPVVSLKDNSHIIERAGYGVLTSRAFGSSEIIKIFGDSSNTNFDGSTTAKKAFEASELITVLSRGYTLYPFKESTLEAFGSQISWTSESLSLGVRVEHKDLNRKYIFAPFSAAAVAVADSNTKFGTKETPAQVRTVQQFMRINTYMGQNGNNRSPHRYFQQTHDIEAKSITGSSKGLIENMKYASYDGAKNTIYNAKNTIFVAIESESLVENVNIKNSDVFVVADNNNMATPGLLTHFNSGQIINCHVIDSKITGSPIIQSMGGFIGFNTGTGTIKKCSFTQTAPGLSETRGAPSTSKGTTIGTFVGQNSGLIIDSYTNANAIAPYMAAAFVYDNANGEITRCFSSATVTAGVGGSPMGGVVYASGFVYNNTGAIKDSYTTATVTGDIVCGFMRTGQANKIHGCYSAAKLNAMSWAPANPFGKGWSNDMPADNYYLDTSIVTGTPEETNATKVTYAEMSSNDMLNKLTPDVWRKANAADDVPGYPFPVLKDMPHRGGYPLS